MLHYKALYKVTFFTFYTAFALMLAMQTVVLARGISSARLFVRHIPVFCSDE